MATRGHLKSVEFKQAGLAATSASPVPDTPGSLPAAISTGPMQPSNVSRPVTPATVKGASNAPSPVASVAAKGAPAPPRFTGEETILLRGLASGATSKEMAAQMRLPRETLYRLIGDLRRKTGASSDTALAVWVLRNLGGGTSERRGGSR
jgi:DNA-binding CsgD family transcriptional regulator